MRLAWPYVGEVARSLLGVLLAIVLALEFGSAAAAVAAGGSAAIAGATALQDTPRRLPMVLAVSAAAGVATFVGSLLEASTVLHGVFSVFAVALWSVGAGLVWSVSAKAGLVAATLGALMVACSQQPTTLDGAAATAALAVIGGLTQAALVAAWPRRQWFAQRAALSSAYRSVAAGARELAADPAVTLDVAPLFTLRETYHGLYGLPERIAMTLTALQHYSQDPTTRAVASAAADTLEAIGGFGRGARADAERGLAAVNAAVQRVPSSRQIPAQRLRVQLEEATALRFAASGIPGGIMGSIGASLRAQLTWNSPILRHALRLGGAAAVGTAVAAVTDIAQGYWIALTVLLVMRPETAHTYTRCIIRVAATLAGIAVATTVTVLWHPTGVASAVLTVLVVGVAYAVSGYGYLPVSAAMGAVIVFLVDITGYVHSDTVGERLLAATLGGALAIAGHVLLPDRSLVRLHQRAGELLKAEIDYAATVIRAFVHPLADADLVIAATWERAVRARSAFEAASGSARADAPTVRRWLTVYRAGLNAVTASCSVLERQVSAARPETLDRRFVVAVDDFVDALRGEAAHAGKAWTLDITHLVATEQQLRESAGFLDKDHVAQRVLSVEVETITRHLVSIADAEV